MKISFILSKTRLPYILITIATILTFFFVCPPYKNQTGSTVQFIILFFVLFFTALYRDSRYRKTLLKAGEGKIKEYIRDGMLMKRRNRELSGALETSKELFEIAMQEIFIKAGNLDHDFYENETIIDSLEKFLRKGGRLRVICAPREQCDAKTKSLFVFRNSKNYNIKILHASERPDLHFMVVDDKHYRVETRHLPEEHYEANIIYNNHFFADFHRHLFIKKWKETTENEIF